MIISHKFRFIFIKTRKTAGTSVEGYLSQHCGDTDVLSPISPHIPEHIARNHTGRWNPLRELTGSANPVDASMVLRHWFRKRRFFNHMPATMVRARCPADIWDRYVKFTIDRDPFEKVMSQYHRRRSEKGDHYDFDTYFKEAPLPLNLPLYTDRDGTLMVDHILRYEDLDNELGRLFEKLGVPWEGALNVRAKTGFQKKSRRPAREVLPERFHDRIRDVFGPEFALNGYPV